MKVPMAGYNERSWAIDLIGHLKSIAARQNRSIRDAGGEQTVKAEGGSLFPDVLLFGDRATARILQGWELKMPDTEIDDPEFRRNAEIKADALGLDSFLLWNVTRARLYVREDLNGEFNLASEWPLNIKGAQIYGRGIRPRTGEVGSLFHRVPACLPICSHR